MKMKRRLVFALLLALGLTPTAASAQRTFKAVGQDLWSIVGDVWYVWISPTHSTLSDWRDVGLVLATTAAVMPFDDDIDRWIVAHPSSVPVRLFEPFTEASDTKLVNISVGKYMLPAAGAVYLVGFAADSRTLKDVALGCASSLYANTTPRHLLWEVLGRERPGTANGDQYDFTIPGEHWEQHSFFGGHVANAAACASFLGSRFDLGVAKPLVYGAVVAMGASRMIDRRHWASDQVLGIAVGFAIGRTVARRQLRRLERGQSTVGEEERAGPFMSGGGSAPLRVGWQLRF
jgi:membrane-associated phospholipid phosphatase